MSAERHWAALDHAFSQLLTTADVRRAHERLAQRTAVLSDIYLRHFARTADVDLTRELRALRRVHRRLTAALRHNSAP